MSDPSPEPITLDPRRRIPVSLAMLGGMGIALGAWLAWRGSTASGIALAAPSAVTLLGALAWLIPSRSYLHLTDRGFIYSTAFNPRRVDWADVSRFGVVPAEGADRVAWDFAEHDPAEVDGRRRSKASTGFEAVLPPCCGMSAGPLAELLERRRRLGSRCSGGAGMSDG
ncbi:hypothetical protein [Tautonia sociabilis]|uniref:PH domain-containing protein n=1 Tax=Tautonia sociabilis TaxID=2080755 RepID=A0A432MIG8_9BACT|nr:hypothetical protein [Tautonia sociabilis]RUL87153.1 hypothetical protein TsocGM_13825 [Tautonia sociabilis]